MSFERWSPQHWRAPRGGRLRLTPARLLAGAMAAALAVVIVLSLLSVAGCSSKVATPDEAANRAVCANNQARIRQMMDLFYADAQMYPPIATVVEKLHVKCPDGGTYLFDQNTATVSCSVHGHL